MGFLDFFNRLIVDLFIERPQQHRLNFFYWSRGTDRDNSNQREEDVAQFEKGQWFFKLEFLWILAEVRSQSRSWVIGNWKKINTKIMRILKFDYGIATTKAKNFSDAIINFSQNFFRSLKKTTKTSRFQSLISSSGKSWTFAFFCWWHFPWNAE